MPDAWDGVPWFTDGGAHHSGATARLLSHAAFGGQEGIVSPRDLQVAATASASSRVRVFPGACAITNRAANVKYEAYAARLPTTDEVEIAPTTASGGRSDLIVVRVENPYLDGEDWPLPPTEEDAEVGPYVFTRVIPGVPANTTNVASLNLGYSALALARIDLPPSTTTITQAMVKDLRKMTNVLRGVPEVGAAETPATVQKQPVGTWGNWPATFGPQIEIPAWATHVVAKVKVLGASFGRGSGGGSNPAANVRIALGSLLGATTFFNVQIEQWTDRTTIGAAMPRLAIPVAMRGTTQTLRLQANAHAGSWNGDQVWTDSGSMVEYDVDFIALPESNV